MSLLTQTLRSVGSSQANCMQRIDHKIESFSASELHHLAFSSTHHLRQNAAQRQFSRQSPDGARVQIQVGPRQPSGLLASLLGKLCVPLAVRRRTECKDSI